MRNGRESRLLLAILRESWDEGAAVVSSSPIRPDVFIELCRLCDVFPAVHTLLAQSDQWDLTGPEVRERLSEMKRKCRSDNLLLLARTEQTIDLLQEKEIVPVALKGLDFLHRFYGMFDQRAMDDVDLLIPPEQVETALDILVKAGYEAPSGEKRLHWLRSSYQIPLSSPGPVPVSVEIHWGLFQEGRYASAIEPILERTVPLSIEGRTIRRLDDHDSAAHLLLHHLQHFFDRRLKWMLDFLRLTEEPGFDWHTLARRLGEWGGTAAAGMALLHLKKLFPERVPREATDVLPAAAWRRIATLPLRSFHPLDLFGLTRTRIVQLYLAAALHENPRDLPAYIRHRKVRDRTRGAGIVERIRDRDRGGSGEG